MIEVKVVRLATLASFLYLIPIASADVVYTFPSGKGGQYITPGFAAVEGNKFQVGASNVVVTALAYEQEQRPNQAPEPTAIFDAAGNILAVAQISGSDTLENGYFWKEIDQIVILSGSQYFIVSLHV